MSIRMSVAVLGGDELPLVEHHHGRAPGGTDPLGQALVLVGDPGGGVDDQQGDVGPVEGVEGPQHREVLGAPLGPRLPAHAGGVDEADRSLRCLDHGVHRVPGGAGRIVGDRSLVTDQPVEQGRLAHVGPADQRHPGNCADSPVRCRAGPHRSARPTRPVGASASADVGAGSGRRMRTTSSRRSPVPRPCRALIGHGSPRPRAMASQASASRWDESTLLTTTRTGRPDRLSTRATAMSSSMTPTVTSTTSRTTSASAMARSAWAVTWASRGSPPASHPPVSTTVKACPHHSASSSLRSRVTPGRSSTTAARRPTMRLTRVDLPTLGRPAMTTSGRWPAGRRPTRRRPGSSGRPQGDRHRSGIGRDGLRSR